MEEKEVIHDNKFQWAVLILLVVAWVVNTITGFVVSREIDFKLSC